MRPSDILGSHLGGLRLMASTAGGCRRRQPRCVGSEQAQNNTILTLIGLARTCSTYLVVERIDIHEDSGGRVREESDARPNPSQSRCPGSRSQW